MVADIGRVVARATRPRKGVNLKRVVDSVDALNGDRVRVEQRLPPQNTGAVVVMRLS